VQPASIEVEPGRFVDVYPSVNEELVEEILTVTGNKSWVRFTLDMIRKELNTRRKTRSE
jgi:sulfite reductase alpha subunit-like flavoprotein